MPNANKMDMIDKILTIDVSIIGIRLKYNNVTLQLFYLLHREQLVERTDPYHC